VSKIKLASLAGISVMMFALSACGEVENHGVVQPVELDGDGVIMTDEGYAMDNATLDCLINGRYYVWTNEEHTEQGCYLPSWKEVEGLEVTEEEVLNEFSCFPETKLWYVPGTNKRIIFCFPLRGCIPGVEAIAILINRR
jgi:hypothetical protein